MADIMEKAKLKYEVRSQKDPQDETKTLFVPAIVERNDPLSLAQVVYSAIDTGRIAGLKTNAAKGIAEGICDQIYQELLKGNSIAFAKYFYISLFLSGTVADAAAALTSSNQVNVRLRQGNDFRVALADFSWSNIANDKSAKLEYIVSASGVRGEIEKGGVISLEGSGFGSTSEGVSVAFVYGDGTEVAGEVTGIGPNRITVAFPAALAEVANGTEITATVTKTIDGTAYVSNAKTATLVAAAA